MSSLLEFDAVDEADTHADARGDSDNGVRIGRIDVFVYRHPIDTPVVTSFGVMQDRPAVFVRLEDFAGAFGWGEIWANWPVAGAEHRANLLMKDIADLVLGTSLDGPTDLYRKLERETRIRALQSGEWGPFRQVIAGLDIAAWDLYARRAGLPVRQLLSESARDCVPTYASGIHIRDAELMVAQARKAGFKAFKVKVGFDLETDATKVIALARSLAEHERLFADANQAWTPVQAATFLERVAEAGIGWLEEPIPADASEHDWRWLAAGSTVPLAGGENLAGRRNFTAAIESGALSIIQPDIAKWGGFTECLAIAREAMTVGRMYCPHFLGGGIGLAASAHILAAAGGDGLLEVDINPNPLRELFGSPGEAMSAGGWQVGGAPGLGIEDLPHKLEPMRTYCDSRTQ